VKSASLEKINDAPMTQTVCVIIACDYSKKHDAKSASLLFP
jgi:hypothetical protein